ncbi:MAG: hypothetical protein ACYSTI_13190 [Planctomycetota bacterium]|jgi:hypothetical protein
MDVDHVQGTTVIETTDLQGRWVIIAWVSDGPNYHDKDGFIEMRCFIGFIQPNGEPGDGYITWLPVFTEWWDDKD